MPLRKAHVIVPPPPPRFTHKDWNSNNKLRFRNAEDQQQLADRIIEESARIRKLTEEATKINKEEVDKKLDERIKDIEFLKKENEIQRKECCLEEEALKTYKTRIEDAQAALKEHAHRLCQKCIILREGRLGIDLCHDDVERELNKEIEIIEGTQTLLQRSLEQTKEQIRLLRSTKYFLDRDNENKSNALTIDKHNVMLKETSLNLSTYHGVTPLDAGNVTNEEWKAQSRKNIERSAKEINNARPLRSYIDILLKQIVEDLWQQFHTTNNAFKKRIEETRDAKTKLENEHREVVRKANDMTRNITELEKAIAEKEGYVALAHTRLGNRAQRPGVELCKDEVEIKLVNEVYELNESVSKLQEMLAEAQASLRYLLKVQIQLEEDINIKTNTLKIDEVDCMTLRQSMDYHAF